MVQFELAEAVASDGVSLGTAATGRVNLFAEADGDSGGVAGGDGGGNFLSRVAREGDEGLVVTGLQVRVAGDAAAVSVAPIAVFPLGNDFSAFEVRLRLGVEDLDDERAALAKGAIGGQSAAEERKQ